MIPLALIATAGIAPSAPDLAEWHNLPIWDVRLGQGRSWEITDKGDNRNYWTYGVAQDLFLLLSGDFQAYDSRTGKLRWRVPNPIPRGYPAIIRKIGGRILCGFFGEDKSTLVALNPKNGATMWTNEMSPYAGRVHAVGEDLAVWLKGQGGTPHLTILSGRDGKVKAELSPADESANRALLMKAAPSMVDQVVLYTGSITRNGVPLPSPTAFDNAWIVGDHLITQYAMDDFPMDLGEMAGFSTFRSFRLADLGRPNPPDRWKERGNGRQYHQKDCASYGTVLAASRNGLVATYHRQIVSPEKITTVTTPVHLLPDGDMVARPVQGWPKGVFGSWNTTKGLLLWGADESIYYWNGKTAIKQPAPTSEGWYVVEPMRDGLLYRRDPKNGDPVYRFRLEPFRTR